MSRPSPRAPTSARYGETALEPADDPKAREIVRPAQRHGEPRYIAPRGSPRMVAPAPMINHTEAEIELLANLLGLDRR